MTLEEVWRDRSDRQLIIASRRLDEYTPASQAVILAELQRRGIGPHTVLDADGIEPEVQAGSEDGAPPIAEPSRSWPARLWHGELSLAVTFWLWGVLGTRAVSAAVIYLFEESQNLAVMLAAFGGYCAYLAVVVVAVWRSSRRYTGRRIWRDSARVSLALGILRTIGELFAP